MAMAMIQTLVTGGDPDRCHERFPVPSLSAFEVAEDVYLDFLPAEDLARVKDALIVHKPQLAHLQQPGFSVVCLWKREGGKSQGATVYGKAVKVSGLLGHFCEDAFVVWLAAAACRFFTRIQVEALMFHELLHISVSDKGKPTLVAHDVEAFLSEIAEYGPWKRTIRDLSHVVRQTTLFEPEPRPQPDVHVPEDDAEEPDDPDGEWSEYSSRYGVFVPANAE